MKKDIVHLLACPFCKGELTLQVDQYDSNEVKEGSLLCECGKRYPIKRYIPRFVDTDNYVESFSFEWDIFRKVQLDSINRTTESEETFKEKTGFDLSSAKGKLFLDAGCGAGRFMEVVVKYGGIVVGVDLSFAVDSAFDNIGLKEGVHIIQADIFNLPFREGAFDFIYSIGVLHHTPDTRSAFLRLPRFLKSGGEIAIYVYDYYKLRFLIISQIWRRITTKLPKRLLYLMSYAAVPLYYIWKIPFIGLPMQIIFPINMHKSWRWRVLDTFDWYSPKYQHKHTYYEVYRWFKEGGLSNIEILKFPVSVKGMKL